MKRLSRKSGFSLVELLTVIAIIAILAAIIFPVMGMVKEKARQNNCMANMKQIVTALQMFKTDNRCYPTVLVPVQYTGTTPKQFDAAASKDGLMGEYVKGGVAVFHCPSSKETDKAKIETFTMGAGTNPPSYNVYRFNSYEGYYDTLKGKWEQHYMIDLSQVFVDKADPDYVRQLKFRNPPDNTVVTWCSNHENREANKVSGKAIVLFLDGGAVVMDATDVESKQWRLRQ